MKFCIIVHLESTDFCVHGMLDYDVQIVFFPSDPPRFQSDFVSPVNTNSSVLDDRIVIATLPGTSLTLLCGVEGNPPPSVNYSFTGGTPMVTNGNILINPVMVSSAGNYTCLAFSDRFPEIVYRTFQVFVGGELLW